MTQMTLLRDKRAGETMEYALIGVLVVVAAIAGLRLLGINVGATLTSIATVIGGG